MKKLRRKFKIILFTRLQEMIKTHNLIEKSFILHISEKKNVLEKQLLK
jgi:DNA-directed RNA polymerase subunit H (RpoH/RPB5)